MYFINKTFQVVDNIPVCTKITNFYGISTLLVGTSNTFYDGVICNTRYRTKKYRVEIKI
jgi:hypothetical protein